MTPQQQLALKLRLERRLVSELRKFFKEYLNLWADARHRNDNMPLAPWALRLAELFVEHYARTIRSVHHGALVETSERLEDVTGPIRTQTLYDQARDQSRRIMDRVERDLRAFEVEARVNKSSSTIDLMVKASKKPTWSIYLVTSMRRMWRALQAQLPVIANMNTQGVAESEIAGDGAPLVGITPAEQTETWAKRWVSMDDERVRDTHQIAHGQIVPFDATFTVGGAQMRFPGDMSLGAPLKEIINCRCLAQYGVMRDGKFVPVPGLTTLRGEARATRRPGEPIGVRQPKVPTRALTFGPSKRGVWRGNLILGTGERATYTLQGGAITIRVGGRAVASAPLGRDRFGKWTLGRVKTDPAHHGAGIEQMLNASVEATNRLGK